MRIAIMFTGALRTVEKTIPFLKMNCLLNENIHVYGCFQNETEKSNQLWEDWFRKEIGAHLKGIQWTHNTTDPFWLTMRCRLIDNLEIGEDWKGYLHNSGSVIEYYQLYNAYRDMIRVEKREGILYDYVIRCRTDTIFCKPIDFHWLNWTEEDIDKRLESIKYQLQEANIAFSPINQVKYFMTTLLHDDTLDNIKNQWGYFFPSENFRAPETSKEIRHFLHYGAYALTFRENLLYIIPRRHFYNIPSLGVTYGMYRSPHSDEWWFNAEGQFKSACYHSGLTLFDYSTTFEVDSLYKYEYASYFDENGILKNNTQLFCLIRN